MVILALIGCSTLSTLDGAKTLSPGQVQLATALSVQAGNNPAAQAGIPLPSLEFAGRVGVDDDVDVGFRAYVLGVGADVRYRFYSSERWNAATGVGLSGLPTPGAGSLETTFPVTVQRDLSSHWAISGGPRITLRDQWNATTGGAVVRADVFAGGGTRVEYQVQRFVLGLGGDLLARPTRHAPPAWSIALAFGFRGKSPEEDAPEDPR